MRRTALLLLLAACGGGAGANDGRTTRPLEPAVRDSAGVAILEHPADALARAPLVTIDSAPIATFAGDVNDAARDVSTINGLTFLSTGDLVGFDRDEGQILVLRSASGERVRLGHKGSGPLELGMIQNLVVGPGDTLVLTDGSNGRFVIATADAGPLRTESIAEADGMRGATTIGRTTSGAYLVRKFNFDFGTPPSDEATRRMMTLGQWRPGNDSVAGAFDAQGPLMQMHVEGRQGQVMSVSLMSIALAWNPSYLAWGDGIVEARGDGYRLDRHDTTGALRSRISLPLEPVPVTAELWARSVDRTLERMNRLGPIEPDSLAPMRERMLAGPHADTLSAYGDVAVTPNGTVWVLDQSLVRDSGWAATAFDRDGRMLGRIEAAGGQPPIAWGDDRVAFKSEDDLGIATITIQRLRLPS